MPFGSIYQAIYGLGKYDIVSNVSDSFYVIKVLGLFILLSVASCIHKINTL